MNAATASQASEARGGARGREEAGNEGRSRFDPPPILGDTPRTPAAWEAACGAAEAHLDVLRCDAAMLHLMREAEDDDATYAAAKASDRKVEFGLLNARGVGGQPRGCRCRT
jgi:hypothetical protein